MSCRSESYIVCPPASTVKMSTITSPSASVGEASVLLLLPRRAPESGLRLRLPGRLPFEGWLRMVAGERWKGVSDEVHQQLQLEVEEVRNLHGDQQGKRLRPTGPHAAERLDRSHKSQDGVPAESCGQVHVQAEAEVTKRPALGLALAIVPRISAHIRPKGPRLPCGTGSPWIGFSRDRESEEETSWPTRRG